MKEKVSIELSVVGGTATFEIDGISYSFNNNGEECADYYSDSQRHYYFDYTRDDSYFGYNLSIRFEDDGLIDPKIDLSYDTGFIFSIADGTQHPFTRGALHFKRSLEERGYLRSFSLQFPNDVLPVYKPNYTPRTDNAIGFYILDKKYKKDKLLAARINALYEAIWCADSETGYTRSLT